LRGGQLRRDGLSSRQKGMVALCICVDARTGVRAVVVQIAESTEKSVATPSAFSCATI
jgi:hypothetical protein